MSDYCLALTLTILVEVVIAGFFGYRRSPAIRTVVLVNLMSHPLLTYFLWVNHYFDFINFEAAVAILEILVVLGEWQGLVFVLGGDRKKLLAVSFCMNLASFALGLIVFPL